MLRYVETRTVWRYISAVDLQTIWFTTDRDAVLLFEAKDIETVRGRMDELPPFHEGLIMYRILGLKPCTGLERLFG